MASDVRLAILASHPIQYQVPLFRHLTARPGVDLTVLFCADFGLKDYRDPDFGVKFRWDVPLAEGYKHEFLRNRSRAPRPGSFWGVFNPEVGARLRAGGYDALLVQGWFLATNWLALRAARKLGLPVLIRGESNGLCEPSGFRRVVKRNVLTRLFRGVDGFLAIGSLNRGFYRSYGVDEGRIFDAPYTVDNEFFRCHAEALAPRRAALRDELGIPDDATVFLFCGKLSPVKRPLDALEAFARLPEARRCRLIYAGEGVLRPEIERRIGELGLAENVRITGFLNQTELPRFYTIADALVLTSGIEPWGLVVNEAMNFGLPALVTDQVGAAPDLVTPGETGFVFPVGDVEALAGVMARVAQDHGLRAEMGAHARRRIATWGIPETAEAYVRAARAVAGARGR